MHPLAFAAGGDDAGLAQIGEVARDFWLGLAEDFNQIADADLLVAHEIEKAQARIIAQGLEE